MVPLDVLLGFYCRRYLAITFLFFGGIIRFIPEVIQSFIYLEFENYLDLTPSLLISTLGFEFLVTGLIIGLFYSLLLHIKIYPVVWRAGIGFALGVVISPIIGNLIGNYLFHSLFLAYILTFTLISIIFGIFLFWGVSKTKEI